MKSLSIALATLGPVGYLPASGTIASIIAAPLVYRLFSVYSEPTTQCAFVLLLIALSLWCIQVALENFQRWDDPSEIVFDELIGTFVTFINIPLTPMSMGIGLILFRFLDILKPFGIRRLEYIGGSVGIVLDDIAAGAGACLLLHLLYWFIG